MKLQHYLFSLLATVLLLSTTACEPNPNDPPSFRNFTQMVGDYTIFMMTVQGGEFEMGATEVQQADALENELPLHHVQLDRYLISSTEVSQGLFAAVMGYNPSTVKGTTLPVESVTYEEAVLFCEKLTAISRYHYVLPTEAQWEYAARSRNADLGFKYPGGNDLKYYAWFQDNSEGHTYMTGMKAPNALGTMDMAGNVSEWCADWYATYPDTASVDPQGPAIGTQRVVRGGSFQSPATDCRITRREGVDPTAQLPTLGFRIVALFPTEPKK